MRVKTAVLKDNRTIFWILAFVITILVAFYIFSMNQTVRNVAVRQTLESELSSIESRVAELEFSYIALKNNITLGTASALGFEPVKTAVYVKRVSSVALAQTSPQTP
jgi:hypothetical protein